jgi:hypothetical protein
MCEREKERKLPWKNQKDWFRFPCNVMLASEACKEHATRLHFCSKEKQNLEMDKAIKSKTFFGHRTFTLSHQTAR